MAQAQGRAGIQSIPCVPGFPTRRVDADFEAAVKQLPARPKKPKRAKKTAQAMNEAETRAEHTIGPCPRECRLGRCRGQSHSARVSHHAGTAGGARTAGAKGLTADYVLVYRNTKLAVVEAKAWDEALTEGVGQAKKLRRQAGDPVLPMPATARVSTASTCRPGERACCPAFPRPMSCGTGPLPSRTIGAIVLRRAVPGTRAARGTFASIRRIAVEARAGKDRRGKDRILLTLATGTGKTAICLSDRVEVVPDAVEPGRRADAPAAHPVPGRSEQPGRSSGQRFHVVQRLQRGRLRAGQSRGDPQEGQGAQERQPVLHHLPDLHERAARCKDRRQALALLWRLSAGLLRLHRHRRVPPRRGQRREHLARHPDVFRAQRCSLA